MKIVLGIESSCDDTSIAIIKGNPEDSGPEILTHQSYSQENDLKKWGGVIPEIAARNHLAKLAPLLKDSFQKAELELKDIDLIAVTTHPGLLGPLLTGLSAAKSLSLVGKKAIYPVNHLYAHLEAIHIDQKVNYPYLGLLVSGGHSLITLVHSASDFEVLGSTIDDAAGEAFDKGGKLMGLGYPAGALIDQLAQQGDPQRFEFPIGLKQSNDFNFSFSGLKTALRNLIEKSPELTAKNSKDLQDLCASYQYAIVSALALKTKKAYREIKKQHKSHLPLVLGGGVACNSALRKTVKELGFDDVFIVTPKYCTDNAAMVANYGLRLFNQRIDYPECLNIDARSRVIDKKTFQSKATR